MKKITLTLDGKKTQIGGPSEKALALLKFLKTLRNGSYYTTEGLAKEFKCTANAMAQHIRKLAEEIKPYTTKVPSSTGGGHKMIIGSKASIKKLNAELEIVND